MNNNLLQIMQMINPNMNPNQIMQQMISQNPQLQTILNQAQQSGMTPQQFAMQYAKQNNINIQPLIQMFNQKGIKL